MRVGRGTRVALGLVGVLLVALFAGALLLHNYMLDGLDGWLLSTVLGFGRSEDTQYAPGYSDEAFRRLRVGMATREVLALLGPPLDRGVSRGTAESWGWSRSPGSRSYRVRVVVFDAERVVEIHSEFYVD